MPTKSPKRELQEARQSADKWRRRAEQAEAMIRVLHAGACINLGAVTLDMMKHTVSVDGVPVRVTPTEYKTLEYLALWGVDKHVTLEQIKAGVGKPQMSDGSMQFHLAMIREHLGAHRAMLRRIRGKGFQIVPEEAPKP